MSTIKKRDCLLCRYNQPVEYDFLCKCYSCTCIYNGLDLQVYTHDKAVIQCDGFEKKKPRGVYIIEVPDVPPSNNKFIGRNVRWKYQAAKKEWKARIAAYAGAKPPMPLERATVSIFYHFGDRRRRDPDNYSGKFILDALTALGYIADDSFTNVRLVLACEVEDTALVDKRKWTSITVQPKVEPLDLSWFLNDALEDTAI